MAKALLIGIAVCTIAIAAIYLFNTLLESRRRMQLNPQLHTPLQHRLSTARWYIMFLLFLFAIVALFYALSGVLQLSSQKSKLSADYARASMAEQFTPLEVKHGLNLSATEQRTVTGDNPQQSEVFIIDATLKDLTANQQTCTPAHLQQLLKASTAALVGTDLKMSKAATDARWFPAKPKKGYRARGVCAVKWRWVASTNATGRLEAVVDLRYRDGASTIYRSKIVPYAIGAVSDVKEIYSLATSIGVSMLSLMGILLSAWLSRKAHQNDAAGAGSSN